MNPDQRRLLEMARRSSETAERSVAAGDTATAAIRAHYAMVYAALAALTGEAVGAAVDPDDHAAVHAAFRARFAKTRRLDPQLHRWLLDAHELRLLAEGDPPGGLDAGAIRETLDRADSMILAIRRFLGPGEG